MRKLILLFAIFAFAAAKVRYDGYSVWRVYPTSKSQVANLKNQIEKFQIDVWADSHEWVDIMMSSQTQASMRVFALRSNLKYNVMIENVQELIEIEESNMKGRSARAYSPTSYNTLTDIVARMNEVAASVTYASVGSIGTSYEGREQNYIEFSTGPGSSGAKPAIYMDCGIHAREWVSPATCMYGVDRFAEGASEFMAVLDTYDVIIVPVMNVDGYEWTFSDDRMWRKNRRQNTDVGEVCYGTDLNRNFEAGWGGEGASPLPCTDTYRGPSPASEVETQNVQNFLLTRTFACLHSTHSYSQMWMYPYAYTTDLPADAAELDINTQVGVDALTAVYGTPYTYGPIATTIYEAAGGTVDYAYDVAGILYSYTLELRDDGQYGFLLPEDQILPTGEETWAGFIAAFNDMYSRN